MGFRGAELFAKNLGKHDNAAQSHNEVWDSSSGRQRYLCRFISVLCVSLSCAGP